jgi:pentatricopeptide repeat protein
MWKSSLQPYNAGGGTRANTNSNSDDAEVDKLHCNLRKLCQQNHLQDALNVLRLTGNRSIILDSTAHASLLQACVNNNALPEGKQVHAHIIHAGYEHGDTFLANKVLLVYAKCGVLADARRVFDRMPKRNVVSWTVMISAYARRGWGEEALALFDQMQRVGIQPNAFTIASILPACASLSAIKYGKKLHREIIRRGIQSNVFVGNALIDMYMKCGFLKVARQVFDKMPERNVVSWNSIFTGYARNGHFDEATELFQKMPERNVVSWTAMIAGYAKNGLVDKALKLFHEMPERNVVSWTAMIAGCVQNARLEEALELFSKMPARDVVSWTAMISGCVQNGRYDEALKLYKQMLLSDVKPNSDTFASLLPACANLAALEQGKEIHEDIHRSGLQSDLFVQNALIDMYAKCGSIEDACKVFDDIGKRDVISWTSMITAYAMHGFGQEALKVFKEMQHSGTKPDHVTFVGVLSACCHAGLVDDGWRYFRSISGCYGITHTVEHYCCMVDLLGRAGHLNEALKLIDNMPLQPDAGVWGALLSACKLHTNTELGEYVAQRIFELEHEDPAPYVLLSNIYADSGRWDDIKNVRKMMQNMMVKNKPGCSWIEVNKQVIVFTVEDRSCPETQKS